MLRIGTNRSKNAKTGFKGWLELPLVKRPMQAIPNNTKLQMIMRIFMIVLN
jgi:hypothetical protein